MAGGGIVLIVFCAPVPQSFHNNGLPPDLLGKCGELAVSGRFCCRFAFRSLLNSVSVYDDDSQGRSVSSCLSPSFPICLLPRETTSVAKNRNGRDVLHLTCVSFSFTSTCLDLCSWVVAQDKFNKFIRFAKTIVGALPPEEVPVDLNDTLQFMKANDMTDHHKLEEEDLKDVENIVANGYEPCSSMVKVRCDAAASRTAVTGCVLNM